MLLYLALAAIAVWFLASVYRRTPGMQRGRWRVGAGVMACVALGAGCLIAARGEWVPGGILVAVALGLAASARSARGLMRRAGRPAPSRALSPAEARSLLGVDERASAEEIQAAYTRLMRLAHPDKGGTTGLAMQLNAARDCLLKT